MKQRRPGPILRTATLLHLLLMFGSVSANAQATPTPAAQQNPAPPPRASAEDAEKARKAQEERVRNDWPNLKRYQQENAKLSAPAEGENRIVFYGDSITDAWIRSVPEFFQSKPYLDRGISGQTTPQMLVRFRQDVINLHPKVVVILAGTNDIAGNTGPSTPEMIQDNFKSMAELARANGIVPVLASILPASDYRWKPGVEPGPKIAAFNAWLKEYAQTNGFVYLDYYSPMVDDKLGLPTTLSSDGVHPNKAGYAIMGPLAEKAIAQALGASAASK